MIEETYAGKVAKEGGDIEWGGNSEECMGLCIPATNGNSGRDEIESVDEGLGR